MIRPESEGGLKDVRDLEGNVLISDTALRDNLPFNLWPIKERYKQVCGCKTCTMMGDYVRVLCQFCLKLLRDLNSKDKERGGRYEAVVFRKKETRTNNQVTSGKKFYVQWLMAVLISTGIVFWEGVPHVPIPNMLSHRKKEPWEMKHHKFGFLIT